MLSFRPRTLDLIGGGTSYGVRVAVAALVALCLIAASATPPTPFDENLTRLRSMPYEERILLAKTLERFDALSSEAQESILAIDQRIQELDPEARSNYLNTLRRYHLWYTALDSKDRELITNANSDAERLAVVEKLRKATVHSSSRIPGQLGLPIGDIGSIPPIELGNLIRVWFKLTDEEKRRIEAFPVVRKINELSLLGYQRKVEMKRLPAAEQAVVQKKLEDLPLYKSLVAGARVRAEKQKAENKVGPLGKRFFENRPKALANPLNHLVESLYFVEHPPKAVDPANLSRFSAALPNWIKETVDPLSAHEARRRLTILYREIYPDPQEMPLPARPATKAETKKPSAPANSGKTINF